MSTSTEGPAAWAVYSPSKGVIGWRPFLTKSPATARANRHNSQRWGRTNDWEAVPLTIIEDRIND